MRLALLILILFRAAAGQSLNVSRDLVAKQIAKSDMTPNQPGLDSRPLLEAAIAYAQKNNIPVVTADPGAYYFLTLHNNQTHVLMSSVGNLTLDFRNSDLYFKTPGRSAIQCTTCTGVVLQNFTVDYLTLPFTQVMVTSVDGPSRTIGFAPMPGYDPPSTFNSGLVPSGGDSYVGFVFRNAWG